MVKNVLIAEPLAEGGVRLLQSACRVETRVGLSPGELIGVIGDYDALIVRSATQVTAELLAAARRLVVIGRAGSGVDNIDLEAATRKGIVVVNAPTSNTVAVAEHTIALMLCLARPICQADAGMHAGRWEKRDLVGHELRYKVLGLVGLGRVGSAVAERARAFAMRVVAYDPFISPERAAQLEVQMLSLDELLARADYVSLHAPATERTRGMIAARELTLMRPSARLINCARGDLIAEAALAEALTSGRIAGAALDVYPDEPHINPALRRCPNLLLTPHLGASTTEAQDVAAVEVAQQVVDVLSGRPPRYPVNVLALSGEEMALARPYLDLAYRMGRFYAQFAQQNLSRVDLTFAGEVARHDTSRVVPNAITASALAGLLSEASEEPVNAVNAPVIARERGLIVNEVRTTEAQDLAGLITLEAQANGRRRLLAGTVLRGQPHIVRIDDYWIDVVASGLLLVSEHVEQPGVIGQMGTLLGEEGINISFVQVGRQARGGRGIMVVGVDDALSSRAMERVMAMPSIIDAWLVKL
jgi:D-3-phosphoglycerate dehydrogenase / 2-oxoglutarate reductase